MTELHKLSLLISQRTRAGLIAARARGVILGRRRGAIVARKLDKFAPAVEFLLKNGYSKCAIARELKVHRNTVSRYLKTRERM